MVAIPEWIEPSWFDGYYRWTEYQWKNSTRPLPVWITGPQGMNFWSKSALVGLSQHVVTY